MGLLPRTYAGHDHCYHDIVNSACTVDTGNRLCDPATGKWLTADGTFASDPSLPRTFPTWRETYLVVQEFASRKIELVLKSHEQDLDIQVSH